MSGEALYERYKDALKRGHVASLRGRVEEALTAYAEAAAIAPERATPHTSAGTALMRRKRPADALRHYAAAIALAPGDEAAHLGRAQALAALDRRPDAADAFDTVAELRASAGKLADAVDAARRGLELAEGRERRRTLERLIERLRATEPGEPGRLALERALSVLDGSAMAAAAAPAPTAPGSAAPAETPKVDDATDGGAVASDTDAGADGDPSAAGDRGDAAVGDAAPGIEALDDVPAASPRIRAALDRDLPDDLDPEELARVLDDALQEPAGGGVERLLDLAAAYRRQGRIDGALDACYHALSLDPDNLGLHLALVELYDERGWAALANEKLALLDRLATLDDDVSATERVAAARTARG
jgi:tetratricopeptide (TPR) repeat protein